ncbi:MAG: choice-of-anchor A family protein [Myxococcales bacterium]|nr:choice-of-anchor A family protein [Myxococcales bacterium]
MHLLSVLSLVAGATLPEPEPPQEEEECGPDVHSTYAMTDYNGRRVIWAPSLFCKGKTALLSMESGTLELSPDGTGHFDGLAQVVRGGNCTGTNLQGSLWDVSYEVEPPAPNTVEKGNNTSGEDWQLGIVVDGVMTHEDLRVTFSNAPSSLRYGHQVGVGANVKDGDLGGAFWFDWLLEEVSEYSSVSLASGHGDFNFDLECQPTDCPTDGSLGPANGLNVLTCGDFTGHGSDIAGAAAVGGHMDVSGYGIGAQSDVDGPVLSVGGDLSLHNGQIYNGDGEVAGDCDTSSLGVPDGELTCNQPDVFDADAACDTMCELADHLAAQTPSNCEVTAYRWGNVELHTEGTQAVCDLDLDAVADGLDPWVTALTGLTVHGQHGATVVVNVRGDADLWGKNGAFVLAGGLRNTGVLWNFGCGNEHCPSEVRNVSVQGSLLAPACDLEFDNGHIDGQYVVRSHVGNGQFHNVLFDGDACPDERGDY